MQLEVDLNHWKTEFNCEAKQSGREKDKNGLWRPSLPRSRYLCRHATLLEKKKTVTQWIILYECLIGTVFNFIVELLLLFKKSLWILLNENFVMRCLH